MMLESKLADFLYTGDAFVDKLQRGIQAAKQERYEEARQLFVDVLRGEPNNVTAWLWLAVCMPDRYRRIECLQSAHEIQPDNPRICNALERMRKNGSSTPPFSQGTMYSLMT